MANAYSKSLEVKGNRACKNAEMIYSCSSIPMHCFGQCHIDYTFVEFVLSIFYGITSWTTLHLEISMCIRN